MASYVDGRSIWPGPECMRSPSKSAVGVRRMKAAAKGLPSPACWEPLGHTLLLISPRVAPIVADGFLPAAGIALAWERVRKRHEGWMRWLKSRGACASGLDFARRFATPEAAALASAGLPDGDDGSGHILWLLHEADGAWHAKADALCEVASIVGEDSSGRLVELTLRFLASPWWAALSEQWGGQ